MRIGIDEAVARLQNGEVVAIPTETVYGLAADARNDMAVSKIFTTKQRPADHPLIVHLGNVNQVSDWATDFPVVARKLAEAFWPGPLTLVLPAQSHVSRAVRGGESTVALRVPNHPLTLALLKNSGLCLAAPSANKFTQLSPTTADHVEAGLGVAMPVLDGGACQVGIESTIVSVSADGQWRLLRPGMISDEAIVRVVGMPKSEATKGALPKAPGQHELHYSPHTPLLLFKNKSALLQACVTLQQTQLCCAALLVGEGPLPACESRVLSNQPTLAAEQLYSALHALDDLQVDRLLIELPQDTAEWTAVRDRLQRAGGGVV